MSTQGWSVAIKRKDGSLFLCAPQCGGIASPVWLTYVFAVAHRDKLIAHKFKAKVVRVEYTEPRILPPKKRAIATTTGSRSEG